MIFNMCSENPKKLKIALVQMTSSKGNILKNLNTTLDYISQAIANHADIVVFPEMNLTGYFTEEQYVNSCLDLNSEPVKKIVNVSEDIAILFGIGEKSNGNKYITQIYAISKKVVGIYRKHNIKNKELKLFTPGKNNPVFNINE